MDLRITVRISEEEAGRAEQLAPVIFDNDSSQRARGPLNQSDVFRLALAEGLAVLEARYGVVEPARDYASEESLDEAEVTR